MKLQFSVDENVMESLPFEFLNKTRTTRFHSSHAVWQLARMGSYNVSETIPAALKTGRFGEITELYSGIERHVSFIDTSENESEESRLLVDILVGFVFRKLKSEPETHLQFLIISSAKSMESSPQQLKDWKNLPEIRDALELKCNLLSIEGKLVFSNIPVPQLIGSVIESTRIEYLRRRHGRLGEESLWGRELEATKVLQDGGIAGADLSHALKTLSRAVTIESSPDGSFKPAVFDQQTARLLTRDFQRRARISMPCVRVIDERFLTEEKIEEVILPRIPSWKSISIGSDNRPPLQTEMLEPALKWIRRAILSCGRGLLPVFFFSGSSGSGRSVLLKQAAWALYQQGYTVAEILDMDGAAEEAEQLASAAVALDSPLILIWDDAAGTRADLVSGIREIAAAQISGVPILLLGCLPDSGIAAKQMKKIARIIYEEFTVHPPSGEQHRADNPEGEPESAGSRLEIWISENLQTSLRDLSVRVAEHIKQSPETIRELFMTTAVPGLLGLTVPASLLVRAGNPDALSVIQSFIPDKRNTVFRTLSLRENPDAVYVDTGHYLYNRALLTALESTPENYMSAIEKLVDTCFQDPSQCRFLSPLFRSVIACPELSQDFRQRVSVRLAENIANQSLTLPVTLLRDLFYIIEESIDGQLHQTLVDRLSQIARSKTVDAFIALPPLLRNRLGGLTDDEILEILRAAKPSFDRLGFRFLLKFLADHLPGNMGTQAIEEARTAAARDTDAGHAIAAYLKLVWQRGSEDQITRAVAETMGWLETQPDDRIVRRAFYEYISKRGSADLRTQSVEHLTEWLSLHFDEGPLRRILLDISAILSDPVVLDNVLEQTAEWMRKLGNNRSVRMQYFRLSEQRNDKDIILKACHVATNWLTSHPDDRDSIRSLIYLSNRSNDEATINTAIPIIHHFFANHLIDRDLLKYYVSLVDRAGSEKNLLEAIELIDRYLDDHPDEMDIRESLLGLAGKKLQSKMQVRIYDKASAWLETQEKTYPMLEYLTGRLGVRAGIARRAIPLLERAAARDDESLQNHARLWLGSAYRIAGEFGLARKEWQKVVDTESGTMKDKALKNIEALESFLVKKFPDGYPPPEEPRPRPTRRKEQPGRRFEQPREMEAARDPRRERPREPQKPQPVAAGVASASIQQEPARKPYREPRPDRQDRGKPSRDRQSRGRSDQKPETPRQGTTLGDLLKLKGLDLKEELSRSNRPKKK